MKINLQKIKAIDDFEYIRILRNTSYIRLNSLNKKIISKNDHKNWLEKNNDNNFFVLKNTKKNIGYIRISKKNYVSWALERNYWGKIKFSEHLKKTTNSKKLKYSCIILRYNIRSQIAALKAGFKLNKVIGEKIIFQKII
tara:strand:- start:719 stop:1138 length:420 start_codon:yes stop_codon:yes gene_type:complete